MLKTESENLEGFLSNAMQVVIKELGSEPYYMKLMLIELIEFNGEHGVSLLKLIAPDILPVFERLVKSRNDLRVTNPAMLMRSFFGIILSYFLTGMFMSGSVLEKLLPKNPADIYVDIMLHGILKGEVVAMFEKQGQHSFFLSFYCWEFICSQQVTCSQVSCGGLISKPGFG